MAHIPQPAMDTLKHPYDVVVIGAVIAGMATAARLQAQGLTTLALEAHSHAGGCAGYFRRRGFAFDVGATTLVDFERGGVGGELLESIGMPPIEGKSLLSYVAWLPDRVVTLYRDPQAWATERLAKLGDTPAHCALWGLLDHLAQCFWRASREGVKLPIRTLGEVVHNICRTFAHTVSPSRRNKFRNPFPKR